MMTKAEEMRKITNKANEQKRLERLTKNTQVKLSTERQGLPPQSDLVLVM